MILDTEHGFSLIELLISIAILAVFASGISLWLGGYKKSADLDSSSRIIISLLRSAQAKALSGNEAKNWGVSFDAASGKISTFSDDGTTKTTVKEDYLPNTLKINADSLLGGCNEIIFSRPNAETTRDCTIRIEDFADTSLYIDISIRTSGFVGMP
ncbi:MAG: prepilin-type N-terminal cleavage/methylation domain-containing protein [Candidatus Paceibacterota bacterium]